MLYRQKEIQSGILFLADLTDNITGLAIIFYLCHTLSNGTRKCLQAFNKKRGCLFQKQSMKSEAAHRQVEQVNLQGHLLLGLPGISLNKETLTNVNSSNIKYYLIL